jgi:hypothetical protein
MNDHIFYVLVFPFLSLVCYKVGITRGYVELISQCANKGKKTTRLENARTYALVKKIAYFRGEECFIKGLEEYFLKHFERENRRLKHVSIHNFHEQTVTKSTNYSEIVFAPLEHIFCVVEEYYETYGKRIHPKEQFDMLDMRAFRYYESIFIIEELAECLSCLPNPNYESQEVLEKEHINNIFIHQGYIAIKTDTTTYFKDNNSFYDYVFTRLDNMWTEDYLVYVICNELARRNKFAEFVSLKKREDMKHGLLQGYPLSEIVARERFTSIMKCILEY